MSAIRPQGSSQQAPSQVAGRGREGGCLPEETIKLGLQFHSLWLWIESCRAAFQKIGS